MAEGRFVAYYRVSTARQGQSGLGLEAQQKAVADYLNGGQWQLVEAFTEIETGKGSNALKRRPQLAAAIAACKKHKATLVIARLDRLARNVHFISGLMEGGIDFVAVDNPHVNRMVAQILAAVAEDEARRIGDRTRAALAAAKARGTILGSHGREVLAPRFKAEAEARAQELAPVVLDLRRQGFTVRQVAEHLNAQGVPSAQGARWHPSSVHAVLKRLNRQVNRHEQ